MSDKCAVALGTFDGLHLGHTAVLDKICDKNYTSLALTFDIPPKMTDENKCGLILSPEDKYAFLKSKGITPVVLDFEKIKDLSPLDFLNWLVCEYHPALIVSGFNYRFGKGATGDDIFLKEFCEKQGIQNIAMPPVMEQGTPISSTRIRGAIEDGDVRLAKNMLGRYFSFCGEIIHGDQRGRTMGFPTMNQAYPDILVTPRFGVYASLTEIDGKRYRSVTNIGKRPTFETDYIISETHLFNYNCDAYGKTARVYLTGFIRDEVRFSGIDELKKAIAEDKQKAAMELK